MVNLYLISNENLNFLILTLLPNVLQLHKSTVPDFKGTLM